MQSGDRNEAHVLREYALLADGERGALVGPRGDLAWLCFPRWDSDAFFSALVGGGGTYAVTPSGRYVWGGYYETGTLIWHGRWVTDDGAIVECREALAVPAQPDRAVLLRQVRALEGTAQVSVILQVVGGFGRQPARDVTRGDDGNWRGRAGEVRFCWTGARDARVAGKADGAELLSLDLELEEGAHRDLVLVLALNDGAAEPVDPEVAWPGTEAVWRDAVPQLDDTVAPRDARHAYAVLNGLTSPSGGMVAAATMSLPERAREGRNYDYRYAWIRDQCYAGLAVARAGPFPLLDASVRFVRDRLLEDGPRLQPAYAVAGEPVPGERRIGVPGYPGGGDVAGNRVGGQFQLDVFGEALSLFAAAAGHDRLDADGWRAVETAVAAIEERWREPDSGIWELAPDEWTHSRFACAAGLRAIAGCVPGAENAARWLGLADAITAEVASRCLHATGRWQRSPRDGRLDGALLLGGLRGAVPADDPRSLETLRAYERELTDDLFAYRYRPDARPLGEAEGAFLLCGFLLSLAHAQLGEHVAAVRWFERNRTACGPPGLLSEEYDVRQRQLRGNLPQAFVHALLLECAVALRDT